MPIKVESSIARSALTADFESVNSLATIDLLDIRLLARNSVKTRAFNWLSSNSCTVMLGLKISMSDKVKQV
jgi:hypothetical protein